MACEKLDCCNESPFGYQAICNTVQSYTAFCPGNEYFDYFSMTGANDRYYDVVRGPVHFFILSSDPREPDGVTVDSIQAQWLQSKLADSTAVWKVVVCHHPPYSSGLTHGSTLGMRWPFAAWGADAVMSGHDHDYERLTVDGIPYFVNGIGGKSLRLFTTPLAESVVRYNADFGAVKIEAEADYITFTAISRAAAVIDTITIGSVPGSPDPTVIGVIGDFGNASTEEQDVATLVLGWTPDSIVTVGDNVYGSDTDIDGAISPYSTYVYPYTGAGTPGAAPNRFFPAIGNHDWDLFNEFSYAAVEAGTMCGYATLELANAAALAAAQAEAEAGMDCG